MESPSDARAGQPPLWGKKIGLVLAGGGAKGAYQAGCLDYLHSQGVKDYHVVAGTSVGSLNGAAAASGKVHELVRIWEQISLRRVLAPSWRMLPFMSGMLVAYLGMLGSVLGLIAIAAIAGTLWYLGSGNLSMVYLLACLILILPYPGLLSAPFAFIGKALFYRLPRHASLAKPHPLRKLIRSTLLSDRHEGMELRCPTYATLTRLAYWFDPDFPSFADATVVRTFMSEVNFKLPVRIPGWLPEYVDLRQLTESEVLDHLVASAALPFAFRQTLIDGVHYLDGGVVDNVPLNKVLEFDCDVVIVIFLQSNLNVELILEHIPRLRRALRLSTASIRALHSRYLELVGRPEVAVAHGHNPEHDEEDDLPWYEGLDFVPKPGHRFEAVPLEPLGPLPEFIEVVPSRPLGGLVTGTLNFSRRKARNLLDLGRADMRRALERYLLSGQTTLELDQG